MPKTELTWHSLKLYFYWTFLRSTISDLNEKKQTTTDKIFKQYIIDLLNRERVMVCLKLGGLDHARVTWISGCLLKLTVWMPLCTETCWSDMDLLHVSTVVLWSHALGCLIAKFPSLKLHLTVHPVLNHLICSFEVLPVHNGGHGSDGVVLFATDTLVDLLDVKI